MSLDATRWVWRHSPLKGAAFAVHLAIADTVDKTGVFRMKFDKLATKTRTSEKNLPEIFATMEKIGLVEKIRDRRWQHAATEWRFLRPDLPVIFENSANRGSDPASRGENSANRGSDPASRGENSANRGGGSNGSSTVEMNGRENTHTACDDFPDFWLAYPKKSDEPGALRAWKSATKRANVEDIAAGFERWRLYWQTIEPNFVPKASKWLDADAWNDPVPKPVQNSDTETRAQRNARETLRVVGLDPDVYTGTD